MSSYIAETGGNIIQEECDQKFPKGIEWGQVAVTSAGNLPCKAIFHGAVASWDDGLGLSETVSDNLYSVQRV